MSAKMCDAKRRAFLKAHAQTGNLNLSAERAGVSKSWVSLTRRSDAAFDSRCRAAKAASAERLGGSGCNRPPGAWKRIGGVDLAVSRAGRRPAQVTRSPGMRWTPRVEGRFLGELKQCNNIRLDCDRAGMTLSSYEAHARRWPDFRRRVREARSFASLWLAGQSKEPFQLDVPEALESQATVAERIRLAGGTRGGDKGRRDIAFGLRGGNLGSGGREPGGTRAFGPHPWARGRGGKRWALIW